MISEEQKTQFLKELSRKSFERGGFVLKVDVLAVLGIGEDDINRSTDFDDLINELGDSGIDYHEDASEAAASEEPDVQNMSEEELEERVRKLEAQVAYLKKSIALKAELRSRTGRRP